MQSRIILRHTERQKDKQTDKQITLSFSHTVNQIKNTQTCAQLLLGNKKAMRMFECFFAAKFWVIGDEKRTA